jgi:nucleoside-diphosphate-sugar epimerase
MAAMMVFVTGATGFMGQRLCAALVKRGHSVRGLARAGSQGRLAQGVEAVAGDPLNGQTYRDRVRGCDTMVHLVGVSHPSPAKAAQFRSIDLASLLQAVPVAREADVRHFVYVSVAHPAPVMKEYIAARVEAEQAIRDAGLNATILRPWYVVGPGRRWPLALAPIYKLMELFPSTREGARRLGLVNATQMIAALAVAVENPATGVRVLGVPEIQATDSAISRSR